MAAGGGGALRVRRALLAVGLGLGGLGLAASLSWMIVTGRVELVLAGAAALVALVITLASDVAALYLLIFSMLLAPQFLARGRGLDAIAGRGVTLRVDDFLLVVIGLAWLAKNAVRKELGIFPRTSLNQPIVTYVVSAILATAMGVFAGRVNPLAGMLFTLKYVQYFIIYFMAVNYTRERRHIQNFVVASLVTCVAVSIVSLVATAPGERLSAPFEQAGEPNTFGGYLVLILGLTLGLYLTAGTLRWRVALLLVAACIILPLLGTLSRASYLAIGPMLLALLALTDRKGVFAVMLLITLGVGMAVVPQAAIKRISHTWSQERETGQVAVGGVRLDTSTSARIESWKQVLFEDWPKQPLIGHGVTGYRFLDAQYPRVLAEMGIVGLFAFLWLQTRIGLLCYRVYRRSRDWLLRGLALGVLAGFVGLVVHSIGANTFIIVRIMEPFWFLVGLVAVAPSVEAAAGSEAPQPAPQAEGGRLPTGSPRAGAGPSPPTREGRAHAPSGRPTGLGGAPAGGRESPSGSGSGRERRPGG